MMEPPSCYSKYFPTDINSCLRHLSISTIYILPGVLHTPYFCLHLLLSTVFSSFLYLFSSFFFFFFCLSFFAPSMGHGTAKARKGMTQCQDADLYIETGLSPMNRDINLKTQRMRQC